MFAAKLSADGSRIVYSTYPPDSAVTANAIAIDAQGAAYIGGKSAAGRAYVLKLSPDGGTIVYNSYAELAGSNPVASNQDAATALLVTSPAMPLSPGGPLSRIFPYLPEWCKDTSRVCKASSSRSSI